MARGGPRWPEVARGGPRWPEVARGGPRGPERAREGPRWPEVAREDPRGPEIIRHHPRLDPAMIRPGRVDVIHEVGDATPHQMRTLYLNFFPDQPQLADAFADALSGSSVSMARRCSRTFARPRATLLLLAKAFLSSRRCCSRTCSSGATRRSRRARARQSWPLGWRRRGTRARCGRGRRRGRQRAGSAGPLRSCWGGWPCQCAHRRLGVRGGDGRGLEL